MVRRTSALDRTWGAISKSQLIGVRGLSLVRALAQQRTCRRRDQKLLNDPMDEVWLLLAGVDPASASAALSAR